MLNTPAIFQETHRNSSLKTVATIPAQSVPTTATVIYTARADADFWIQNLFAANRGVMAADLTINLVPAGGSVAGSNEVVSNFTIAATGEVGKVRALYDLVIAPGTQIVVTASSLNAINVFGWGYEIRGGYQ